MEHVFHPFYLILRMVAVVLRSLIFSKSCIDVYNSRAHVANITMKVSLTKYYENRVTDK